MQFGDLTISFVRHEVFVRGRPVNLTPTEFRLLETLGPGAGPGVLPRLSCWTGRSDTTTMAWNARWTSTS